MPKAAVNGIELYYEVHGDGEPVLLIPGLTADHTMYLLQVPALAPRYRCILVDNRGVGQSSQPEGPYTIRQMADDAAALLDHLGIERAHVVGISMGGAIAQELAIEHPERVRSAAIVCSWGAGDEWLRRRLWVWREAVRQLDRETYVEMIFGLIFTHRFYEVPGAVDMVKAQVLNNPYPQTYTGFLGQAAACEGHHTLDRLHRIQAPTLVLAGAEDMLLPPRYARAVAERIPGAVYEEMPEAGHGLNVERAEEFNRRLLAWLEGVSPR